MKILLTAAVLAATVTSTQVSATLVQISGNGLWPTAAVATDHIVPGATYAFSFRLGSPYGPPTGEISNGTTALTAYRFAVGGVAVAEQPDYVLFFVPASLGGFDLAYPSEILSFYGADIGSTGTVTPGSYRFANSAGGTTAIDVTAVPELGQWSMLIAGFGVVGAAARRRRVAVI